MIKKRHGSGPREQLKLAGTERTDRIPEIDALAEEWRDLDEQSKGIKVAKEEIGDHLVDELTQRKLERYVYENKLGELFEITVAELTVKVKIQKLVRPHSHSNAATDEGSN